MNQFKRTIKTSGNFKALQIMDNNFIDSETGEIVQVSNILSEIYGDAIFSLQTSRTEIEEVEVLDHED